MRILRRRRAHDGPLDCAAVAARMDEYLDAELDAATTRRVAEHLEDCRRCGLEVETYQRIKDCLAHQRPALDAEATERLRAFGRRLVEGAGPEPTT